MVSMRASRGATAPVRLTVAPARLTAGGNVGEATPLAASTWGDGLSLM